VKRWLDGCAVSGVRDHCTPILVPALLWLPSTINHRPSASFKPQRHGGTEYFAAKNAENSESRPDADFAFCQKILVKPGLSREMFFRVFRVFRGYHPFILRPSKKSSGQGSAKSVKCLTRFGESFAGVSRSLFAVKLLYA
jgi:hypothetical protein